MQSNQKVTTPYASGQATLEWMTGHGKAIEGTTKKIAEDFRRVVWKESTKVGFGRKGDHIVAWYCSSKSKPNLATGDNEEDFY
jgi:hypothetical protein